MMKRSFDFVLALGALLVLAPFLLILAVLIKLDSRGPVFFRQERIGKDGRPFRILKFRTMVDNAYTLGPKLTQKHDPRITRIGQLLRWLKLDELPQVLNVLSGEMSFVGPRPEDPHFVQLYTSEQREVLSVRPGIVGPNQILGRDEAEQYPDGPVDTEEFYITHILPDKLAIDLTYVRTCGLWGDMKLIAAGLWVTFFGAFKPKFLRLNKQRIALFVFDIMASLGVYQLVYGLKLDWHYGEEALLYLTTVSGLILLIRPPLFVYYGLYNNLPRYLGVEELLTIVKAVTVGSISIIALTFLLGFQGHSRSVFIFQWSLLIVVLFGARVALRTWMKYRPGKLTPRQKTVLIIGADDAGVQLAHALSNQADLPYHPIGFLDDDPAKRGMIIHGIRVLGKVEDFLQIAALNKIDVVVILASHFTPASLRRQMWPELIEYCRTHEIEYRVLPTMDQILTGGISLSTVGEYELHEIMGVARTGETPEANGVHLNGQNGTHAEVQTPIHKEPERCVLVTGGAGYVGSHLVRKLLNRHYRVRVLDNFLYEGHGLQDIADHPRLEVLEGDVRHLATVARAAKGVDGVIALAALVGDAACDQDPEETMATNYESVRVLADVCRKQQIERLVFASSCSVYGANSDLVLNEGSWLNPVSLYAQTRVQAEEEILRLAEGSFGVVILRLATVFGLSPRMRFDLLVNTMTLHAVENKKVTVFGGQQWRPNLHVQDAAEAFILGLEAPAEKACKSIFNVGANENNYTILQVAELVKKHLPQIELVIEKNMADKRDYRVSFDKIRYVLGFQPRFTVEDGIIETATALIDGRISNPTEDIYHNARYLKKHNPVHMQKLNGMDRTSSLASQRSALDDHTPTNYSHWRI